jgi:hypothetical protein
MNRDGVLLDEPGDRRIAVADGSQLSTASSCWRVEVEQDQLVLALGALRSFLKRYLPPEQRFGERLGLDHGGSCRTLSGKAYPDAPGGPRIVCG